MPVDKSDRRIREMFGEISPRYDFLNHFLSAGTDYYWRWRCVRAAPAAGDLPILDVCTGTGDLAVAFWKRCGGRVRVVGADFTHEMLRLANRKVEAAQCSIEFVEADAQRLPFADSRFQIVSVAFGLRNVSDTQQGLREMARVCAPGGKVVVLEFSMPRNRVIGGVYGWYFRNVLPRIGQLISGNRQSAYSYLPDSVSEFPSGQRLADMMNSSGLERVTWQPLTFGLATVYVGTKAASQQPV
ncbi:MAG TPA: bifunctional demethylmenaquinone methyltransferase/2-methoxy-6-polyprenyl-1,4-benzoquinol methylase UbiE [Planctomycetaceae bacterium]|jgi:demethylmenaquinone methyltransferase/2-methoxy-6-polyprenyl-1,4-benzoquinol methylase|nr:bifunctional demethylmenaquinone methyltransferase/2-methoxy-6-polyprenyl-1,4-benzoquinol methylase UbiE [Planctomycetaceae bacterium]